MRDESNILTRINRSIAWMGLASTVVHLLDVVALVLLLRYWVSPEQLGVATLAISIFPLLDLATDLGLGAALVHRDDHTPERLSTVFWLNLAMALGLAGVLALLGPMLGRVHGQPIIGWMLMAYGGKLVWQSSYTISAMRMKKELRYRELSLVRIGANLAEFAAKLGFAVAGFGIWCFVLGPMARSLVTGIACQWLAPYRPRLLLRLRDARDYLSFGLKSSASQMLFHFYTNVDYQIVGWFFGTAALGLYRAAYELILEPVRLISNVVVEVAFPAFTRLRDRRDLLVEQLVTFTRQNLVVVMPFLGLVLLEAETLLGLFFGPGWTAAANTARLLCIVGAFRAVSFVLPPLLDGIGKPGVTLKYMVTAAVLLPASYIGCAALLGDSLGYLSVAVAWVVGYPLAFAVLAALALAQIDYSWPAYLRRVLGIPLWSALAMAAGAGMRWLTLDVTPGLRLAAVALTMLVALGLLLARFEQITPASLVRAVRGGAAPLA